MKGRNLMEFFKNKQKRRKTTSVQTSRAKSLPFFGLDNYSPLGGAQEEMFDSLREAIPVIDAAIDKILRLVGGVEVKCRSSAAQKMMDTFLKSVKVGAAGIGIEAFLQQYLDRLLTWGTAVCEIVPSSDGRIGALYCADNKDLELLRDENPLKTKICIRRNGTLAPIPHPERVILTALRPLPGEVKGNSILKGLPFVSSILLKIYNCIGTNWERAGNLRYAVTYKPSGNILENSLSGDAIDQISNEWSRAMNSTDGVRDFVAVGDVNIKVIGGECPIPETDVPARQMLEQIVAKLGIPPFMLGLCWSSTERMSQQQADILTSELESYRKLITPVLIKICSWELAARGYFETPEIVWNDINLQDEVEAAKAILYKAQAMSFESGEKKEEI